MERNGCISKPELLCLFNTSDPLVALCLWFEYVIINLQSLLLFQNGSVGSFKGKSSQVCVLAMLVLALGDTKMVTTPQH